jgi:hypothetical protein
MHQWNPEAVDYMDPWKEQGGLFCGEDGVARKPYPNRNLCYETRRKLPTVNMLGGDVYLCQTVLPGDEAMRIPNFIPAGTTALLAVPGVEYWSERSPTGAHYYINSPNVPVDEACVWGTNAKGAGNVNPPFLTPNNFEFTNTGFVVGSLLFWNQRAGGRGDLCLSKLESYLVRDYHSVPQRPPRVRCPPRVRRTQLQ